MADRNGDCTLRVVEAMTGRQDEAIQIYLRIKDVLLAARDEFRSAG